MPTTVWLPRGGRGFAVALIFSKWAVQQCPFDEASELLKRLMGIDLSDKQIEGICHYHGQLIEDELYMDTVEGAGQTCYYVEIDGSMPGRPLGLRAGNIPGFGLLPVVNQSGVR